MNVDILIQNHGFLRDLARSLVLDESRVDDVVQDVALTTLVHPPSSDRAPRGWLATVLKNRVYSTRRAEMRRNRRELLVAHPEGVSSSNRDEVREEVVRAVLSLPDLQRDVILLRFFDELDPKEIAERLGVPVGTVGSRLSRALVELRGRLDQRFDDDRRKWVVALAPVAGLASRTGGMIAGWSLTRALSWLSAASLVVLTACGLAWIGDGPKPASTGLSASAFDQEGGAEVIQPRAEPVPLVEPGEREVAEDTRPRVFGVVTDPNGVPVPFYPVRYKLDPPGDGMEGWVLTEAITNAEGRYDTGPLVAGALWMDLLPENGFGPDHAFDAELDGPLEKNFTVAGDLVFAGRVVGEVDDSFNLELDFVQEMGDGGTTFRILARQQKLGPDGSFRFVGMRPGRWNVKIGSDHHVYEERELRLLRNRDQEELRMALGCTLSGQVELGFEGDLTDVTLWLNRVDGEGVQRRAECDETGRFKVWNLSAGAYSVLLRHTTGEVWEQQTVDRNYRIDMQDREQDWSVVVGENVSLTLKLNLPDGWKEARGRIEVADAARQTKSQDFRVYYSRRGALRIDDGTGVFERRINMRDDMERLPLEDLPAGSYQIRVSAPGCEVVAKDVLLDRAKELEIDLVPGPECRVTASVSSDFWEIDARPVDQSEPWKRILWRDARVMITHTPIPGEVHAALPPGDWEFRVRSSGNTRESFGPISIGLGSGEWNLDVPETPGAVVSGTVVSGSGVPSGGSLLHWLRMDSGVWVEHREKVSAIQSDGTFDTKGLAPGTWRLSLDPSGSTAAGDLVIPDGEEAVVVELRLRADGSATCVRTG